MRTWLLAAAAALLLPALPVHAQVKRTFLNLSFEEPNLVNAGCRVYIPQQFVPGWDTDHPSQAAEISGTCTVPPGFTGSSGRILEIWHGPRDNSSGGAVNGRSGAQLAELNAAQFSRIFQNICLVNGERVNYKFSHRGRQSATVRDVMTMRIGTGANSSVATVGTTNNGAFDPPVAIQGTIASAAASGGWRDYTGAFTYLAASGNTNIGFEAVSAAGGTTSGNFLDDIQVQLAPFVDFPQTASSTPESSTSNLPAVRVNGTLAAAVQVVVRIVGGDAVLGTDYEFLSGTVVTDLGGGVKEFRVTVPAGTYDWSASGQFPMPIRVLNDTLADGDRTLRFQIQPPATAGAYLLASSTTCGAAANDTWTYTIGDDEAVVTVVKTLLSSTMGSDPSLFTAVYRIDVANPSTTNQATYSLVDRPQMDPDLQITSAGFRRAPATVDTALVVPVPAAGWPLATGAVLAAGAGHSYTVTIALRVNRGGSTGNDACAGPGTGLYNLAAASVPGLSDPISSSACQATQTPVWVTLAKALPARAVPGDQFRVAIVAAGITRPENQAQTSGTGTSASTGVRIFPAGDLLGFSDIVGPNGNFDFGSANAPVDYLTDIQCSNARPDSGDTQLPSGPGVEESNRQFWGPFASHGGDDIACTITNTPRPVDLAIAKSVALAGTGTPPAGAVRVGTALDYTLLVSNVGQRAVTGAVVRDTPGAGLNCPAAAAVTCTSTASPSACPAGALTVAQLTGAGITLGRLPATAGANTATLRFTCTVTP